jgi:transcriptional antiterminator Rof (Rho-off)
MRGALLEVTWRLESGEVVNARLRVHDVPTRAGAEYLCGETPAGESHEIRLDRISLALWVESGQPLDLMG